MRSCGADAKGETPFVRVLNAVFRHFGGSVARHPWKFIGVSCILTLLTSIKIPFTEMTNDVGDFTPLDARARAELQVFSECWQRTDGSAVAELQGVLLQQGQSGGGVRPHNS